MTKIKEFNIIKFCLTTEGEKSSMVKHKKPERTKSRNVRFQ